MGQRPPSCRPPRARARSSPALRTHTKFLFDRLMGNDFDIKWVVSVCVPVAGVLALFALLCMKPFRRTPQPAPSSSPKFGISPNMDALSPFKCSHTNCHVCSSSGKLSHRREHEENPGPHVATCGPVGCTKCLSQWGCSAVCENFRRICCELGVDFAQVAQEFVLRAAGRAALEPLTPVVASTPQTLRVRPV